MHYFDPTLDWPKELLEESMPDLVVIHSQSLSDPAAPWNEAVEAWTTDWIQYASADGKEHFINMIFLNGSTANDSDRRKVAAYLSTLTDRGTPLRRYRGSNVENGPLILSSAPTIQCRPEDRTRSPVALAGIELAGRLLKYEFMEAAGSGSASDHAWPDLHVEVAEAAEVDTFANAERTMRGVCANPLGSESQGGLWEAIAGGSDGFVLYVVASSAELQKETALQDFASLPSEFDIAMW